MAKKAVIKGKSFNITRSTRENKKFMAIPSDGKGKTIHFGAKGMRIKPGTPAGDNYCARSSGIKSSERISANDFSRWAWNCKGKKSISKNFKLGDV